MSITGSTPQEFQPVYELHTCDSTQCGWNCDLCWPLLYSTNPLKTGNETQPSGVKPYMFNMTRGNTISLSMQITGHDLMISAWLTHIQVRFQQRKWPYVWGTHKQCSHREKGIEQIPLETSRGAPMSHAPFMLLHHCESGFIRGNRTWEKGGHDRGWEIGRASCRERV